MNSSFLYHAWGSIPINVPKKNTKVLQLSYMWKQKSVKRLVRYAVTHIWSRTAIE